jgi:hypothetical protein
VAQGLHGLHLYAHEFLIKHILRYAELQSYSKSSFSEALSIQLERLLLFQRRDLPIGFNAALRNHKSLPHIVHRLSALNLPFKLQLFIRNMLVFQEMSANGNHHEKTPQGEYSQGIIIQT